MGVLTVAVLLLVVMPALLFFIGWAVARATRAKKAAVRSNDQIPHQLRGTMRGGDVPAAGDE